MGLGWYFTLFYQSRKSRKRWKWISWCWWTTFCFWSKDTSTTFGWISKCSWRIYNWNYPKLFLQVRDFRKLQGMSSVWLALKVLHYSRIFQNSLAYNVTMNYSLSPTWPWGLTFWWENWLTPISSLTSRQTLYERFFFGPPHLMHAAYFDLYDRDRVIDRVDSFLNQT